ncbi:MAG: hypothetical protein LBR32_04025 [Propionibacteriaceae bacterium]|nr:hypothetical protein [Propionibacteriaceae bacterium]
MGSSLVKFFVALFAAVAAILAPVAFAPNAQAAAAVKPKLNVQAAGSDKVTLSWSKVKKAKGYRVERLKGGKFTTAKVVKGNAKASWTHKPVKAATKYTYRVVGCQKVKSGKCVPLRQGSVKAVSKSVTVKTPPVTNATKSANARATISAMLGQGLYTSRSELNTRAIEHPTYGASHPYLKFVWDDASGALEFHVYLRFQNGGGGGQTYTKQVRVGDSWDSLGSKATDRSFSTMVSQFVDGVESIYAQDGFKGSAGDFGSTLGTLIGADVDSNAEFHTRLVVHQPGEAGLAASQRFLEVNIGGDAPQGCSKNWYSVCSSGNLGMGKGENHLYVPWDHQANSERGYGRAQLTAGYKLMMAHELAHAMAELKDGYNQSVATALPDRMLQNTETAIDTRPSKQVPLGGGYTLSVGKRYSNIMEADGDFMVVSGSKVTVAEKVFTANDIEMMLWAYRTGLASSSMESQRYNDWKYCFKGLTSAGSCTGEWTVLAKSPVIVDTRDLA